jgi:hypothetical protein
VAAFWFQLTSTLVVPTLNLPWMAPVTEFHFPLPVTVASRTKRIARSRNTVGSPWVVKLLPRRPGPCSTPE